MLDPFSPARRIVVVNFTAGECPVQDKRPHTVGKTRGEVHADWAAFGKPEQRRPVAAGRIQDGAQVVGTAFQGGHSIDGVRQTGAELVVQNHPCERRQFADERRPTWIAPEQIDVREPARNNHQVRRTVPHDLIGEVSFRALCVARLRLTGHRRKVSHLRWFATTFQDLSDAEIQRRAALLRAADSALFHSSCVPAFS